MLLDRIRDIIEPSQFRAEVYGLACGHAGIADGRWRVLVEVGNVGVSIVNGFQ